jgi:hypothetical protein
MAVTLQSPYTPGPLFLTDRKLSWQAKARLVRPKSQIRLKFPSATSVTPCTLQVALERPCPVSHPEVGRYFTALDPHSGYTPNAELEQGYPDELEMKET